MYYEYPESPEAYIFNKQVGLAMDPLISGFNLYNFSISLGLTYWLLQLPPQWTIPPVSVAKVCGFQRFVKGWESECVYIHDNNAQSDQGSYISWFTGETFSGDHVYVRNYTLYEIPVFVRAGSIIPMKTDDFGNELYIQW